MKNPEFENSVVKIYRNEKDRYLLIEHLMPALHTEIVVLWARVILMMATKKLTFCIVDACKLGTLSEKSDRYINEIVLPKLLETGVKKVATIINGSGPHTILSETTIEDRSTGKFIIQQVFVSFENAVAWIKQPIINHQHLTTNK